ncbi:MAG TPA: hypothetical protein PLX23_01210 [Candidatus Hydrogenedens sp.]|nr:hypothetical protein [Candidatus Hydrogenedens sp.]
MQEIMVKVIVLLLLFFSTTMIAYAHKPIAIDGETSSAEKPYEIKNIDISQVAYHNATEGKLEIWLKFYGEKGKEIKIQLGSPKLDDSKPIYFPAIAILSKNMPSVLVPFSVPNKYGGTVFNTQAQKPEIFYEKFTGTYSWIFPTIKYILPETADYYIVGYLPEPREGKFWIAVGEKEKIGLGDFLSIPNTIVQVRNFHETFPVGGILFWLWCIILIIVICLLLFLSFSLI